MTARPRTASPTAVEVNRVVVFTNQDAENPDPDSLCLLKREVNEIDLLELSDNPAWVTRTDAFDEQYRRLFRGSKVDRYRQRYRLYGSEDSRLQAAITAISN